MKVGSIETIFAGSPVPNHALNFPERRFGPNRLSSILMPMHNPSPRTKAENLWDEMSRSFPHYPTGVVPVPERIRGTAFFPGGLGLWIDELGKTEPNIPEVMVVGQDFNTLASYKIAFGKGSEVNSSQTWRNIETIFPKLGLSIRNCYFTNFYMGLRESGPETGLFPGARDPKFVQRSAHFFERQLEVMAPKLIVTLGMVPLAAVARHIFQIPIPKALSKCVDVYRDLPTVHGSTALVALTHPSLYFANVGRRRFQDLVGLDAERAMVQSAAKGILN
jgi:hypothetical protein